MAQKKITDLTLRSDFDATCNIPVDDTSQTWRTTGAQLLDFITAGLPNPTIQKFLSGSGTYTTPANCKRIVVTLVGAGGGGAGSGTAGGTQTGGTTGGNSTFGSSLLVANGGTGASPQNTVSSPGGSASLGSGPIGLALTGGSGQGSMVITVNGNICGGIGGSNPFGGAGVTDYGQDGTPGIANTGAGGGGASTQTNVTGYNGAGGGAGGYVKGSISSPSATYPYACGAGGAGGSGDAGGSTGNDGGAGGAGLVMVEEYYF